MVLRDDSRPRRPRAAFLPDGGPQGRAVLLPGGSSTVGAGGMSDVSAVKSKRMPRAVREQQMMDAAVRTFAQRGYRAASMDEIAELAGVSKPLVYLYLNSKEELFTACIRRESKALVEAVRAGVEPGIPADRQLWSGLRAFFTHTAENPDGWAVLHQQASSHGEPFVSEVGALREEIVAFVTGLIGAAAREAHRDRALPDRDVAGLAQALVGRPRRSPDGRTSLPASRPRRPPPP